MKSYDISGTSAVITGGSRGIGKRIAQRFAGQGVNVAICSRTQQDVDRVATKINEGDYPGQALPIECDVTDRAAVEAMFQTAVDEFGGVSTLVNNAGGAFIAPFDEVSPNGWRSVIDLNLTGVYHCTHIGGDYLKRSNGSVINISSIAGTKGAPRELPYATAKAGLINFTKTLAFEWARESVRVNCVAPGLVATAALEDHWEVSAEAIDRGETERRIGTPEEIADVVYFLACPASSFINGETIIAQGVPRVEDNATVPSLEDSGP